MYVHGKLFSKRQSPSLDHHRSKKFTADRQIYMERTIVTHRDEQSSLKLETDNVDRLLVSGNEKTYILACLIGIS